MSLKSDVEAILARLDAGEVEPYEEDTSEDVNAVYELEDEHGRDMVRALVECAEGWSMGLAPHELPRAARDMYKGHWDSPGAYARDLAEELGDESERLAVAKWGRWIDWEAYAEGDLKGFEFVKIPGRAGVFVFQPD